MKACLNHTILQHVPNNQIFFPVLEHFTLIALPFLARAVFRFIDIDYFNLWLSELFFAISRIILSFYPRTKIFIIFPISCLFVFLGIFLFGFLELMFSIPWIIFPETLLLYNSEFNFAISFISSSDNKVPSLWVKALPA